MSYQNAMLSRLALKGGSLPRTPTWRSALGSFQLSFCWEPGKCFQKNEAAAADAPAHAGSHRSLDPKQMSARQPRKWEPVDVPNLEFSLNSQAELRFEARFGVWKCQGRLGFDCLLFSTLLVSCLCPSCTKYGISECTRGKCFMPKCATKSPNKEKNNNMTSSGSMFQKNAACDYYPEDSRGNLWRNLVLQRGVHDTCPGMELGPKSLPSPHLHVGKEAELRLQDARPQALAYRFCLSRFEKK